VAYTSRFLRCVRESEDTENCGEVAGWRRPWSLRVCALAQRLLGGTSMHPNNLGSTTPMTFIGVTDETGATIQKTIYYPWGQAWASAGTVKDNRFAAGA